MPLINSPLRVITIEYGPICIGLGLAVVLLAQLWPAIPIAAAIALIGLGASLSLMGRPYQLILALNWLIYASLVALAVAAQFDMRPDAVTRGDALLAGAILTITALRIHP